MVVAPPTLQGQLEELDPREVARLALRQQQTAPGRETVATDAALARGSFESVARRHPTLAKRVGTAALEV